MSYVRTLTICLLLVYFVQNLAKENDGVNYLLVVIYVFSKYVWVRPMKNKTVHSLLEAFDSVLSEGRKPEKLRTDKGTEFPERIISTVS